MSRHKSSNEESRTNSVGRKRPSRNSEPGAKKKRKRNRAGRHEIPELLPSGSSFSILADQDLTMSNSTDDLAPKLHPVMTNLGRNRLAAGFARPAAVHDNQTPAVPTSAGESAESVIEISDEEDTGESEGGMVLNLQEQQAGAPVVISDDEVESGEYSSSSSPVDLAQPSLQGDLEMSDENVTSESLIRLADLDPEQLEDQMCYAFYYLERDQVDLNRPVICLQCFSEGHLSETCQTEAQQSGRMLKVKPGTKLRLWISCCICASKEHLVGDCPRADKARAQRWSLTSLDPDQIVNLSLQSGTRRLETEAENRGLRPAGLQIRGRAGRHTAGHGPRFDAESSEEDFFHNRRGHDQDHSARYDRFDAPSGSGSRKGGPGPGDYYATDSFGRRRSRSPEPGRFYNGRRSPSPPMRGDRWQPPRRAPREPFSARYVEQPRPSASSRAPTSAIPAPRPNIRIQLPERRGSNPFLEQPQNMGSASIKPSSTSNRDTNTTKPKRNRKPKPAR